MSAPVHSWVSIWSAPRSVLILRRDLDRQRLALGILVLGCAGRCRVPHSASQQYLSRRGMKTPGQKVAGGHGGHGCSHGPGSGRALGRARFLGRRRHHSRMPSSRPTAHSVVRQQAYPTPIVSFVCCDLWPGLSGRTATYCGRRTRGFEAECLRRLRFDINAAVNH